MYYLIVALTAFLIYLVIYQKSFIGKHSRWIEFLVVTGLIYSQYLRYIAPAVKGTFSIARHLPFYPCRLTPFVLLLFIVWRNKNLESILFFLAAMGLAGVIAPAGNFGRIDTSFIYVYDHVLYSLIPFYLIHHKGYVPSFHKMLAPLVFLSVLSLMFVFINPLIGADYFYVSGKEMLRSDVFRDLLQMVPENSKSYWLFFIEAVIYLAIMSLTLGVYRLFNRSGTPVPEFSENKLPFS